MANNNYLFSLDEETADILKQIPKSKRSAYVRDGVKLKARTIDGEKPEEPEKKTEIINLPKTIKKVIPSFPKARLIVVD